MNKKMTRSLFLLISIFSFSFLSLKAQVGLDKLSKQHWKEDLQFLSQKINKQFASFTPQSRSTFNEDLSSLNDRIDQLSWTQIVIEMNRVVAALKDGHTELNLLQNEIEFHRLPILMYYFEKDLHIIFTSPEYQSLLGKKVVKIGDQPIDAVYKKILPHLAHDNETEFLLEAPNYMTAVELLTYLGITKNTSEIAFTLENAKGQQEKVSIKTLTAVAYAQLEWATVRGKNTAPLYIEDNTTYYWYRYLEKENAMYFKCNRFANQKGKDRLKKVVAQLFKEIEQKKPEKLVIDLRLNRGGNYHLGSTLVSQVKKHPYLNQKGKLFVLTDRYTFSAASAVTGFLKRETNALVAGEPNRSRPNGADNYEPYSLPNSNIRFGVTNKLKDLYPEVGNVPYLPLDISVSTPFSEYQKGRDPVLLTVLSH